MEGYDSYARGAQHGSRLGVLDGTTNVIPGRAAVHGPRMPRPGAGCRISEEWAWRERPGGCSRNAASDWPNRSPPSGTKVEEPRGANACVFAPTPALLQPLFHWSYGGSLSRIFLLRRHDEGVVWCNCRACCDRLRRDEASIGLF